VSNRISAPRLREYRRDEPTPVGALVPGVMSALRTNQRPLRKIVDRVGEVYGRLTVKQFEGVRLSGKERQLLWRCECDCGRTTIVSLRNLSRGHVQSCGCLARDHGRRTGGRNRLEHGQSSLNQLFSSYARSARERGHIFELRLEEFRELTQRVCFYCGAEPDQAAPCVTGTNGAYVYNGVDRINNDVGYIKGNVRACCKRCNVAKADMSESAFFAWVARVYAKTWETLEERGDVAPTEEP
jgi:hypothetical protein